MSQEIDPTPDAPGGVTAPGPAATPAGGAGDDLRPGRPTRRPLGCWGIGAITCGSLFLIFAVFCAVVVWLARPHMGQWMGTFQEMAQCTQQLQAISGALGRYRTAHGGKYPPTLAALYPVYISRRSRLHCPADPSPPEKVSYQYTPPPAAPADDAGSDAVVVTCNHHQITLAGHTSIYLLQLLRNGQVRQRTTVLAPGGLR
jgi:hypothetical protein